MNVRRKKHTGLDPPDRGGEGADPEMRGTGTSEGSGLHPRPCAQPEENDPAGGSGSTP